MEEQTNPAEDQDQTEAQAESNGSSSDAAQQQQTDISPAPAPPAAPEPTAPAAAEKTTSAPTHKSADERKQLLAQTIQTQVAGGARVESQSDFQAVVVRGHRPNHTLHFIVGLFTLGIWWLVWIGIAIFGGEKRKMITVDEFGNVTVQKL